MCCCFVFIKRCKRYSASIPRSLPGTTKTIYEWFRDYKIPDGKPPNNFAFDGKCRDRAYALQIIEGAYFYLYIYSITSVISAYNWKGYIFIYYIIYLFTLFIYLFIIYFFLSLFVLFIYFFVLFVFFISYLFYYFIYLFIYYYCYYLSLRSSQFDTPNRDPPGLEEDPRRQGQPLSLRRTPFPPLRTPIKTTTTNQLTGCTISFSLSQYQCNLFLFLYFFLFSFFTAAS